MHRFVMKDMKIQLECSPINKCLSKPV